MNDIVFVNVVHGFANLTHKDCTGFFSQNEFVVEDAIKQLAAVDSARGKKVDG